VTIVVQAAKAAAVALCFVYIFRVLWTNIDSLQGNTFHIRWWPLFLSCPVAVAYLLGRAATWHVIVRKSIGRSSLYYDLLVWLAACLGKYLPGKVFLFLGRVYFYRRRQIKSTHIAGCLLLESCGSAVAAVIVFSLGQLRAPGGFLAERPAVAVLTAISAAVLTPAVIYVGVRFLRRLRRFRAWVVHWSLLDSYLLVGLMVANWYVLGTGLYLLIAAVTEVPMSIIPYATAAFSMAGIMGVLALFAPSGIGVREGVLTFFLSQVLPPGIAVIVVLMARVWLTVAEALLGSVSLVAIRTDSWHRQIPVQGASAHPLAYDPAVGTADGSDVGDTLSLR
jgi:hypothetical protein